MSVTLVGDEDGKLPKSKAWIMYRIMVKFLSFVIKKSRRFII
jgi:hypothetical protein